MDEIHPAPAPVPEPAPALRPAPAPVMDVMPPPTAAGESQAAPQKPDVSAPKPAAPKAANPSVNAAIAATVIIVLGLGLLAVYAYLKQH